MSLWKKKYTWKPDIPDHRDFVYAAPKATLPSKVDLRGSLMPPVYDQGQLGSCTANAIAGAVEFELRKQKLADFMPSRLFIYYNERLMEGTVAYDAGAMIRDGIKSVNKQGVTSERVWPYSDRDPGNFTTRPTPAAYTDALKHTVTSYYRVSQTTTDIQQCLADGYPVVFGFAVYTAFESAAVAKTGVLGLPRPGEIMLGGHAVLAVGYDNSTQRFLVRNSWGTSWGQQGYFTMPYAYLTNNNLADDLWTIRLMKG